MLNRLSVAVSSLVLLVSAAMGQTQVMEDMRQQFPEEDVVYLGLMEHISIGIVNDELDISRLVDEQVLYLTAKDLRYTNESIYYSSFEEIVGIEATTSVPNSKGKYKVYETENFQDEKVMTGGVFFDDYQKISFVYPAVEEGAITRLRYKEKIKDPRMLGAFFFNSYIPANKAQISISFPEEVKLSYTILGEHADKVEFMEETINGLTTYIWSAKNMPKFRPEADAPGRTYYDTHVILKIDKAEINGEEQRYLGSVDDLYSWYRSLVSEINQTDQAQLKELVESIIEPGDSDEDKTRKIYQWVQDNISYVAFEDGMGGFIPRDAMNVCNKKYGDCKDMSNLMREMLDYAGIEAYLTWIGTRAKPYKYEEVPTPVVDNHMITTAKLNGEYIFLDGTGNNIPFGLPTPMIQGKEALIGISQDEFLVKAVPVVSKDVNVRNEVTSLTIEEQDLIGSTNRVDKGFKKSTIQNQLYSSDAKDERTFFEARLNKGGNNFELLEYTTKGLRDKNVDTELDYKFKVPKYVKAYKDKMYINLNLHKPLTDQQIDLDTRKYDKKIRYCYTDKISNQLTLPAGYKVDYTPEDAAYQNEQFGFSIKYIQTDGVLTLEKELYINSLMITKASFSDWNDFIAALNKAYKETVVLIKE